MSYDGVAVPGLSRFDLRYVNTGRTPIREADVVSPPSIAVDSGTILEARIEDVAPTNLAATLVVDSAGRSVAIHARLLNPKDAVRFTLFTTATPPPPIRALARIAGVRQLALVDQRPSAQPLWRRIPWSMYAVGTATVFAMLCFGLFLYMYGSERVYRHNWHTFLSPVVERVPARDVKSSLQYTVGLLVSAAPTVVATIDAAAPDALLSQVAKATLFSAIESQMRLAKHTLNRYTVGFFILSLLGIAYILVTAARMLRAVPG